MQSDSATRVLQDVGRVIRDARLLVRWTQQELGRRAEVSQSRISRIEGGRCRSVRVVEIDALFVSLGVRYALDATLPQGLLFVRDAVHARCATYVQRRLEADGWLVRREVEIGGDRSRGWIDVLAFHPISRILLVIEIKTEIRDIGALERSLNWYAREASRVALRFGWRATAIQAGALVLATVANDGAIRANRPAIEVAFAGRALEVHATIESRAKPSDRRFLAMVDPRSRRRRWLIPTMLDGRRSSPRYMDYVDAARQLERKRVA